jgi:hypothetical protein
MEPRATAAGVMRYAAESLAQPLDERDANAVAGLLNALAADMRAFRHSSAAADEPATIFLAVEGQP